MLSSMKKLSDSSKASVIERDLLREEYHHDRDSIIEQIKFCLKEKDYSTAQGIIKKYQYVAGDDPIFKALSEETSTRSNEYRLHHDQQTEVEKNKTLLEVTPDDDYKTRYELCRKILEQEPDNANCKSELAVCEKKLGLNPNVSKNIRIGRHLHFGDIKASYVPNKILKDKKIHISSGDVTLRVHTHGISIKHARGIYRLHHSQIISMYYNADGKMSNFLAMAAGATVGLLLGGALLGAAGAAVGNYANSKETLYILYLDKETNTRNVLNFKCKDKADVLKFIEDYEREIQITKETQRRAGFEENYLARILLGLLILGIIAGFILLCVSFWNG